VETILSDSTDTLTRWSLTTLTDLPEHSYAGEKPTSAADSEVARQKGYDEGFAEGLAAGRARAEAIANEMSALIDALAAPFQETDAALLRELLSMTERVARAVTGREINVQADIERVLSEALMALGSVSQAVELLLNPADAALCRDCGLVSHERFTITEDPAIQRGGLQLRSGNSFIDASVDARIEAALSFLRAEAGLPEGTGEALSAHPLTTTGNKNAGGQS